MKNHLIWLATLGPLGSFRGSGTYATLATLPLMLILSLTPVKFYFIFILFAVIIGLISIRLALPHFPKNADPAEIVVDEIVGTLITFFMIPISAKMVILGTILFRFLDIKKPFFLKKIDGMGGATAIMLDDIAAAIIANLIMQAILFLASC